LIERWCLPERESIVDIEKVEPYPLRLAEIWKPKIWGGRNLETALGKQLPEGELVGESWEVSDRPDNESMVSNGACAGRNLHELVEAWGPRLLGRARLERGRFPLLCKFIDANRVLSVQVHPDDTLAAEFDEPDVGKTEMWYVIDARPAAKLVGGVHPDATVETFREAIESAALEPLLVDVPVRAGDALFISPGTVHAIGEGIVLAEIQRNSDLTYRVYDWGRLGRDGRPRPLHIEKALKSIVFGRPAPGIVRPLDIPAEGARRHVLAVSRYFAAEKLEVDGAWSEETANRNSFLIVTCIEGEGSLVNGDASEPLDPGTTFLLPASAGSCRIEGSVTALRFWVPDIEREIVPTLRAAGHSDKTIGQLAGINMGRG